MINILEAKETVDMIARENLDVRTITMGISLLDCIDSDLGRLCDNIYNKITSRAAKLVKTGEEISKEYGIPIVHKRISVTPIGLIGASACRTPDDFVQIARTLDKAAKKVGVNFLDPFNPEGACGDRCCLLLSERRIHQNRDRHGCGPASRGDGSSDSRVYEGAGFTWLCKACDFLQCAR